jgi:cellulose synthase operon protein C
MALPALALRLARPTSSALFACIVALSVVLLPGSLGAQEGLHGSVHPEVTRRTDAARRAPAHQAYAELRLLWQAWDEADPAQVEAALGALAADRSVAAPVRVYAGVLEAYARRRRGDLEGAKRQLASLGFVSDWFVIGPFDNDNRTGLAQKALVEDELAQPIVLDRAYQGKTRGVSWRRAPDVHRYGFLDLGAMIRPVRDVCAYATTYVRAPRPKPITVWFGLAGAGKLWHDDALVATDEGYRDLDAERRAVTLSLRDGFNRITVKVCGDDAAPALALRFGAADGAPDPDLEVAATEAASTSAARSGSAQKASAKGRVNGPLDTFDEALATAGDKADPALLESFARYLYVTGGDADATHQARDLARRAAEAAPTVDRLLLAARLAEDRNGVRRYLAQAEPLAKAGEDRLRWLLLQARWLRAGPNPREAFPLYAEALRIDRGSIEALLGEVDLYVEAGLARTALTTLERASEAQPQAVALLRNLASQLRGLGRDTEAAEVEGRYAGLRFDDGGYLKDQLDLAVARRDGEGAKRWAARLLEAEPASTWAQAEVARARLALGDRPGAIAAYEAALEVAPEDVPVLRALSDLYATAGRRAEQVALLRQILRILPQAKAVRQYLEHIEPQGERSDERYAWPAEKFLEKRAVTDDRHSLRTLRKLTVTTVYENGLASHFKQVVFQPLTDEAAARGRQYAFVYHADRQVVTLRAAKVYRQDGRVDEAIESGEAPANDPSINMYTLQRTFYVQFPRLEPGDVVELRYRIEDVAVQNEMSDYFGEVEYLQSTEPVADVEYVLIAPKDKKLHISTGPRSGRAPKIAHEQKEADSRVTHRFHATDVPALETEPRMPRFGELLAHVHVSTFPDWKSVGSWYLSLARDKMDADDDVRRLAKKLTDGLKTDREKVAAIYAYAAGEIRYVALEFGIEGIRPRRAALTLARGWGDCKDKATLIVSMLREIGIGAELVLVRTGMRGGFEPKIASLAPFDHAIAYVPSLDLYLDGTAEHTGTGELPAMDRSAMALRITDQGGELVTLPEAEAAASIDTRRFQLDLRPNGELAFDGRLETRGVDAPSWRRRYLAKSTQRERLSTDLASSFGGPIEITDGPGLLVKGLAAVEEPVVVELTGAASAPKEGAGFSVPMGPGYALVANYAARPGRSYDVLVGPQRLRDETWVLRVPAGMKVASLPQATKLETPFGSYLLEVEEKNGHIEVRTRLSIDRARIAPGDYAAWRAFCQAVDASAGARVVLTK